MQGWKPSQGELAGRVAARAHPDARPGVPAHPRDHAAVPGAGAAPGRPGHPAADVRDEFIQLRDPRGPCTNGSSLHQPLLQRLHGRRPGNQALGFIMTVYRRRLTSQSSGPSACPCSAAATRLAAGKALALADLLDADDKTATEDDDSARPDVVSTRISADLLAEEIAELDSFIADIEALGGAGHQSRPALRRPHRRPRRRLRQRRVFTQYTDTMDYLRERLAALVPARVALLLRPGRRAVGPGHRAPGSRSPRTSSSSSSATARSESSSAPTA